MAASFFFYDLETSGFRPRADRIMQFAGQRTDMNLKPIGEPVNVFIKMTADILPGPDAVLLTGITPQKTLSDGISEAEFLKLFYEEVVKPDTIFTGFNSIRFDDEFMRFLHYRNFYDAYEWQWKNGCSKWDLLDLVRMTRALRPEGIEWPFASDGKPANRLEMLTSVNKIKHVGAHDALSDVMATIAVAKLIKDKQPDLFSYLLSVRDKRSVAKVVESGEPFIYTSGKISSEHLHTTAAVLLAASPSPDSALIYDLRHDPKQFLDMDESELAQAWHYNPDPEALRLPVKTLKYNRVPAIAPMGVVKDKETQERLELNLDEVSKNLKTLRANQAEFAAKMLKVVKQDDEARDLTQTTMLYNQLNVDDKLYDGFVNKGDANLMRAIRVAKPEELPQIADNLRDQRLQLLAPLYKARNYPKSLSPDEQLSWDKFCYQKIVDGGNESRMAQYFKRLEELAKGKITDAQKYLLEELQLYGQSVIPDPDV